MKGTKQNYLEIHVGISTRAKWYLELQNKMKRLLVECKKKKFHIQHLMNLFLKKKKKKQKQKMEYYIYLLIIKRLI
jgi:hypothetical protein